jgi:hypothetical protein
MTPSKNEEKYRNEMKSGDTKRAKRTADQIHESQIHDDVTVESLDVQKQKVRSWVGFEIGVKHFFAGMSHVARNAFEGWCTGRQAEAKKANQRRGKEMAHAFRTAKKAEVRAYATKGVLTVVREHNEQAARHFAEELRNAPIVAARADEEEVLMDLFGENFELELGKVRAKAKESRVAEYA